MLFIPFIENAFKHWISFHEPSHINNHTGAKGFFDVYNSKHPRYANDPEMDKNGIGLQNVKQRLQLISHGYNLTGTIETLPVS